MSITDEEFEAMRAEHRALQATFQEFIDMFAANALEIEPDTKKNKMPAIPCKGCNLTLCVYNPETEELQIRVKDQYVYSRGSPGSYIRLVCRRCGTSNKFEGT